MPTSYCEYYTHNNGFNEPSTRILQTKMLQINLLSILSNYICMNIIMAYSITYDMPLSKHLISMRQKL